MKHVSLLIKTLDIPVEFIFLFIMYEIGYDFQWHNIYVTTFSQLLLLLEYKTKQICKKKPL